VFEYWRDSYKRKPRPIRRLMWWWLLPFAWMILMGVLITVRLSAPSIAPSWIKWVEPYGMFLGQFIAMGITIYKVRGIRRDFDASGGRLCTECGHNLSGLPDIGNCPECGHHYDIEMDRLTWKEAEIVQTKR
jgi:hypothetical protein